jgi:16S rRNA (cytosine1402-N4)-methyltransferase
MLAETVAALVTDRSGCYVDGTVGEGGHARAILDALEPAGQVLGLDRDPSAIDASRAALAPYGARARLQQSRFSALPEVLTALGWTEVDGIVLDLGLRSDALDDAGRGFSFQADGPLDMRFDPTTGQSAAELLRRMRPEQLRGLLEAGTTRARPETLARAILEARRRGALQRTGELVACLRAGLGRRATPKLLSSVFATLRMAVNEELEELDRALATMPALLKTGGVLCVLAYQSQEDRRVKGLGRAECVDPASGRRFRMVPLWKGPRRPSPAETARNPRARSACLRAFRRSPLTAVT